MGPAIALGDVVGVAEDALLVRVIPLKGYLDDHIVALIADIAGGRMQSTFLAVEVGYKCLDPTFVLKNIFCIGPLVDELISHPRVKERQLPKSFSENIVVHHRV